MANLNANVAARVTLEGGKRPWVVVATMKNGKLVSNPPAPGTPLYLRWYVGSTAKFQKCETDNFDDACIARMRKERELKAHSQGFVLADAPSPLLSQRHRIADLVEAYIGQESKPDKNGDVRPAKSLNSIRAELELFTRWAGKQYVEELTRDTLAGYRDWLATEGKAGKPYQPDTIYNKLMTITTVLKNNPLVPTKPLLPVSEFPDKKETIPDPYTGEEFNGFMEATDYETALLIYAFITTGMRDQEWANADRQDINWELGTLYITKKRSRGFAGKTRAALREVPLNDDLLAELKLPDEGLLFPAPEGGVDGHFLRRVEEIALKAGIKPTTVKPHMKAAGMVKDDWLHRFRDTYITNQLHLHCANMAETMQLIKRIGHADMTTLEKYFGKLKKPYEPVLPDRHRKAKNISEMRKSA